MLEVLAAYQFLGLVLISDAVIVIALFVFGGASLRPYVIGLAAIMTLGSLVIAVLVVSSGRGALINGILAQGEVLTVVRRGYPQIGQKGLVRVDAPGGQFEAQFEWAGSPYIEAGERIRLLILQRPDKVLLTLGPA